MTQDLIDVPQLVREAMQRCGSYLSPTPLEYSLGLSEMSGAQVDYELVKAGVFGMNKLRFRAVSSSGASFLDVI